MLLVHRHSGELILPQSLFWTCPVALQSRDGNTNPGCGCWQRQKYPKVGHSTNTKPEDAANIRNNLAFAGRGLFQPRLRARAVGQWVGEEPGLEMTPPKISFPCDLNDNSSYPASWLDWETSFLALLSNYSDDPCLSEVESAVHKLSAQMHI